MFRLLFPLVAALNGAAQDDAIKTAGSVSNFECPVPTPHGQRLATAYATSELYARVRQRDSITRVTESEVRPVRDGEVCNRLMAALEARAKSTGGTLTGFRPEFYEAGSYYYAVFPVTPSRCTPRPGYACIDTRWQALKVFDRDFNLLVSMAI